MKRVLVVDPIAPEGEAALCRCAELLRAPDAEPDTVRRLAREADGIITRSKLPEDIFEVAPRVRAVAIHGTGTDLVPLSAAALRGVMVANVPGANAQSVAEYCVMAMLMLARNIVPITRALRSGTWDSARALGAAAHEISAMTLGLVGVGAVGTRLARIARNGLGMTVLGHQRHLERLPPEARPASLEEVLSQSEFVVVCCPLTPQTHHLLDRTTLGRMRPTAWLVNVGRGAVIDETALVEALHERRIAGAMLDVYEHYRLPPGHPLFALDNVILTPHLAGMTHESRQRISVAVAEEMLRMLTGERPRNPVLPPAGAPQA